MAFSVFPRFVRNSEMVTNNLEFPARLCRFADPKVVRLIVDKKILEFMIVLRTPERTVEGEESVYGF